MPPLAPTVTQSVADDFTPCPAGTQVATIAPDPAETDPGPFTYALVDGIGTFSIDTTSLVAAVDLTGDNFVSVTATSAGGTSPETGTTITVGGGDGEPVPGENPDDSYAGNPQIPPPLPSGTTELPWELFMKQATQQLRPHARDGVDFVVAKPSRYEPMVNVHWDDVVLGPRPDAEIEALARQLATEVPIAPVP